MRVVWMALVVLVVGLAWSASTPAARVVPAEMTVVCTPSGVATFHSWIQVRCTQSFSGVSVFAVGADSPTIAARYMTLATSAMVAGRNVRITFDPADQGGPARAAGCSSADCRPLRGLEIF